MTGNAVRAMRIATGEEADDGKDPAAKALGSKGGKKRAENMTPERARRDRQEGGGKPLAKIRLTFYRRINSFQANAPFILDVALGYQIFVRWWPALPLWCRRSAGPTADAGSITLR